MADLREDFVNYVVKALVTKPEAVVLKRVEDEKGEYLELTVDSADMGKVIGKAGATAKSLRTLLRGVGAKEDLPPLPIKIVDPEGSDFQRPERAKPGDDHEAATPEDTEATADAAAEDESAEPEVDEHAELRERTKREAEELADLEL